MPFEKMPCDAMDVGLYSLERGRVERRPVPAPERPVALDLTAFGPWRRRGVEVQPQLTSIHRSPEGMALVAGEVALVEPLSDLRSLIERICKTLGKTSEAEHWTNYLESHWIYDIGRVGSLDQSEWESLMLPDDLQHGLQQRVQEINAAQRSIVSGYARKDIDTDAASAYAHKDSELVAATKSSDLRGLRAELNLLLGSDWVSELRSALIGPQNSRASRSRVVDLKTLRVALSKLGITRCSESVLNGVLRVAAVKPSIEDILKVMHRAPKPSHEQTVRKVFQILGNGAPAISLDTLRKAWVAPTGSVGADAAEVPTREALRAVFLNLRGLQHVGEEEFLLAHQGVSNVFAGADSDFARLVCKTWGIGNASQVPLGLKDDLVDSIRNGEHKTKISKENKNIPQLPADLYASVGGLREAAKRYGPSSLHFLSKELKHLHCSVDGLLDVLNKIVPQDFELRQKLRISETEVRRVAVAFSEPYGEFGALLDILGSKLSAQRAIVLHEVFRSMTSCLQRKSVQVLRRQCQPQMVSRCKMRENVPQLALLMQNIVRNLDSHAPESIMREGHFLQLHEDLSRSVAANDVFQEIVRTFWGLGQPSNAHLVSKYRMRNKGHEQSSI